MSPFNILFGFNLRCLPVNEIEFNSEHCSFEWNGLEMGKREHLTVSESKQDFLFYLDLEKHFNVNKAKNCLLNEPFLRRFCVIYFQRTEWKILCK